MHAQSEPQSSALAHWIFPACLWGGGIHPQCTAREGRILAKWHSPWGAVEWPSASWLLSLSTYSLTHCLLSKQNPTMFHESIIQTSYRIIREYQKEKTFKIKLSLSVKTWEVYCQSLDMPSSSFPVMAATVILLQMVHEDLGYVLPIWEVEKKENICS